jgi:hypothetical protein
MYLKSPYLKAFCNIFVYISIHILVNAVKLVLKMAKENHQVSVTLSEAQKFYEEAIKEKIYSTTPGGVRGLLLQRVEFKTKK